MFSDFPLGNPAGAPYDCAMQREIAGMALDLLASAIYPGTTVKTPFRWPTDEWRANFMHVDPALREVLLREGEDRKRRQALRKEKFSGG